MSKLQELIQVLCPNGVEYKKMKISDICINISSGGTPNTSQKEYYSGSIPWLRTQEVDWNEIHDTGVKISKEGYENSSTKMIPKNCVIVAMYGATAAKVAINKIPLCTNQACCNLEVNPEIAHYRFVYYWFCNEYENIRAKGEGSQRNINSKKIKNLLIPIPPLAVQEEIVRILDKFTTLEAELDCRKRQYEYYRDKLLNFNNKKDVVWKPLGEVAELKRGTTITKKTAMPGTYPVISGGQQPAYYVNEFNRTGETITIAGSGAYAGFVMYWNEPIFVSDAFSIVTDKTLISPRYTYYYLLNIQDKIYKLKSGGGVPHVYAKDVARFLIPIPPLSEQERIVEILDKFHTLTHSLSEGLPKEIALRRRQYEYYRNKLLTFAPR